MMCPVQILYVHTLQIHCCVLFPMMKTTFLPRGGSQIQFDTKNESRSRYGAKEIIEDSETQSISLKK